MKKNEAPAPGNIPFFSVIIPVHNKAEYLEKSLACVYAQTFRSFEVIAVDDCSTDGSLELLQRHEGEGKLSLYQRNIPGPGGYAARNLGVSKARAEWVVFFDADDSMHDNHLSILHAAIAENEGLDFFCNNYVMKVGDKDVGKNKGIRSGRYNKLDGLTFFAHNDFIHMNSACTRKGFFDRLGGFPEGRYKRGGDVYFWVKLLARVDEFYYCDVITSEWHLDNSHVTKNPANLTVHPLADFIEVENPELDRECDLQLRRIINRKIIAWATEKKLQGRRCYQDFPHVSLKGLGYENVIRMLVLSMPFGVYQAVIDMKRSWRA
ncbi:glycosyltransferase involved in cell wall biosynthesis [Halomonas campaniensis]|uniref:Glycosyltransferase involved in cell wall biosynthesis n=1 Tax=Halomonas campaniensis TaxID=213554 RepID=A0A7W5K2Y1_9GAMM|nr:glycosyltransferase family A protein [Halomonas campaniensis]MBB3330954.1 glycosyltransferase involved in cell wall biosynthesis [Halomonas campaniensis]